MATFIHGIAASENIDSSGERIIIAGLDISSLEKDGVFNWEHKADQPAQIVGKVLKARKIFVDTDCEDDHQRYFWEKIKVPFLYVMGELMDDYKDSAKEVAGMFRYDADKKGQNERSVMNFSIEGAKMDKKGMDIARSIARKVTLTALPCNKAAVAEMVPVAGKSKKNDIDSLFKTEVVEVELFRFESPYAEFLKKKEEDMNKSVGTSWNKGKMGHQGSTLNFQHPEHGMVSVHKHPSGHFEVKHNGALAGLKGVKGTGFKTAADAGRHAGAYMTAVSQGKTAGHSMHNRPSPQMLGKAMEAGSALGAAPSELSGGAALASESLVIGKPKKKKSRWLARAEEEYNSWEKKEAFRSFMQKKLPHMAMGEIDAIGKVMALKKSMTMEKALSRINPAAYQEDNHSGSSVKKTDKK